MKKTDGLLEIISKWVKEEKLQVNNSEANRLVLDINDYIYGELEGIEQEEYERKYYFKVDEVKKALGIDR